MSKTPLHYTGGKGYDLIDVGIDYQLNFLDLTF